ncbi:MAG: C-type lectin domain-containing protein [Myxococcota bacterium]
MPESGLDAGSGPDGGYALCPGMEPYVLGPTGDHCYRVVTEAQTHDRAVARCAADGAYLAVIDSREENDFVGQLAGGSVWLGYTDRDIEGAYTWVDGSDSLFEMWTGERPVHVARDCVVLDSDSGGTWEDRGCGETYPFVCEFDPGQRAPMAPACMDDANYDRVLAGRPYRLAASPARWQAAQDACAADGAYLVVISDAHDNALVRDLGAGRPKLWLGYTDIATEGSWQWINGAAQDAYRPWGRGEPNNANNNEHCAEMVVGPEDGDLAGAWNDGICTGQRDYVCECDPLANAVGSPL